jgi:hypothetical protein
MVSVRRRSGLARRLGDPAWSTLPHCIGGWTSDQIDKWARRKPTERERIGGWHQAKEDVPQNGVAIDATGPIARVADEILRRCQVNRYPQLDVVYPAGSSPSGPLPILVCVISRVVARRVVSTSLMHGMSTSGNASVNVPARGRFGPAERRSPRWAWTPDQELKSWSSRPTAAVAAASALGSACRQV